MIKYKSTTSILVLISSLCLRTLSKYKYFRSTVLFFVFFFLCISASGLVCWCFFGREQGGEDDDAECCCRGVSVLVFNLVKTLRDLLVLE